MHDAVLRSGLCIAPHSFHVTVRPVHNSNTCTRAGEKLVSDFCLPSNRAETWRTMRCLHDSFLCSIATSDLRLLTLRQGLRGADILQRRCVLLSLHVSGTALTTLKCGPSEAPRVHR